jgi:hypothetical protein
MWSSFNRSGGTGSGCRPVALPDRVLRNLKANSA